MTIKIFISHAASDVDLAQALVDCINSSIVIEDEEIRCTSVPGHKLPIGGDAATIIQSELATTGVVIGLLTRNSLSSSWVLFELGAAWGAKKSIQPLLSNEIEYKDLPGPLSGSNVARLSERNDLTQFISELGSVVGTKVRTPAKVEKAIAKLLAENEKYSKIVVKSKNTNTVVSQSKIPEPTISGMKYSELAKILKNENVIIPSEMNDGVEAETSVYILFVNNPAPFGQGLQSNYKDGSQEQFIYTEVALRLVQFDLVKFEKLPAAQAKHFKRLILTPAGQKFLTHYKRLKNK